MSKKKKEITPTGSPDSRILVAGVVIGALVGLGAAYLISNRVEENGQPVKITSGEGIKLGLLVLGMLRQIASM
jgi:phage protein U